MIARPHTAPSPRANVDDFTLDGTTLKAGYSYSNSRAEANVKPRVVAVAISGTIQEGAEITIVAVVLNPSGYAIDSADVKIYKANDKQGTSEAISATIDAGDISIDENLITALYTVQAGDIGKNILAEVAVTLAGGQNATSDGARSEFSESVISASSPLDVFDAWRFQIEDIDADWNSNAAATWLNRSGSNAVRQVPTPQLVNPNGSIDEDSYLEFIRADSKMLSIPKGAIASGTEVVMVVNLSDLNAAIQNILAFTGSSYIRINSYGQYQINGVNINNAAVNPAEDNTPPYNYYVLRVRFAGAASFIQVNNNVTKVTFNDGGVAFGSGNANVGGSSTATNFLNGRIKFIGRSTGNLADAGGGDAWPLAYAELVSKYV